LEKFSLHKTVSTTQLSGGVRTIAFFEALKGMLVLVAGCGLLSLVHHDLQAAAERLVRLSHLDPAHHYPRVFIEASANLDDARLRLLAALALLYAGLRFIEAYGLWRMKAWAAWLAIISGAMYLPVEVFELSKHATCLRGGVLLINAGIVIYLVYFRCLNSKSNAEIACGSSAGAYQSDTPAVPSASLSSMRLAARRLPSCLSQD
jgi:uncharacterized membrane protein (DUF2068 family)